MTRVTLYTKPGCHLCDAVKDVIDRVRARRGFDFDFETRDISQYPEDHARYWDLIPVVLLDGREIARYRLTESELERALNG